MDENVKKEVENRVKKSVQECVEYPMKKFEKIKKMQQKLAHVT